MDDDMKQGVRDMLNEMDIGPNVKDVSMRLALASDNLIELLTMMKRADKKAGLISLSTVISGLTLTLSDNVDEALGVLKKAREQIIETEKEVNQR